MSWITRRHGLRALAHRDFRLLLAETTVNGLLQPVQYITTIFWIQDHHPDQTVLFVALLAALRGAGLLICSLFGGAIADRFQRRRVLLGCESVAAVLAGLTAVVMLTNPIGGASVALVLGLAFFAAANQAVDMPARAASLADSAGKEALASAISLNTLATQLATPVAFPVMGILNGAFDSGRVYLGSVAVYAIILPLVLGLRYVSVLDDGPRRDVLGNIREGLAYARRDSVIFGIVAAMLVLNLIGAPGVASLAPVWMTKVLGLSKTQFGFMAAGWGIGAVTSSLFFTWRHRLAGRGMAFCGCVLLFAVAAVIFGHSRFVPLTALMFFLLGFSQAGTLLTSATIIQQIVPDEMRGRLMALFPLAQGVSMLNAGPVGVLGQAAGLQLIVPIFSWSTLVLVVLLMASRPTLRRVAPGQPQPAVVPLEAGVPADAVAAR